MNKTKIDWCDLTWNPLTGCLHGCKYCYARKIAERFGGWSLTPGAARSNTSSDKKFIAPISAYYGEVQNTKHGKIADIRYPFLTERLTKCPYPFGFMPTFHKYRLDDYKNKSGRNIFVCSMADLFGDWVPDEWIYEVFEACRAAPQHRYLFLTKNPDRYLKLDLPWNKNFWFGSTVTGAGGNTNIIEGYNNFVSIEPLLGLPNNYEKWIPLMNWVIIGAETGNRKDKVIPKREWISDIVDQCRNAGVPVFMKESIRSIMGSDFVQEFPWEVKDETAG